MGTALLTGIWGRSSLLSLHRHLWEGRPSLLQCGGFRDSGSLLVPTDIFLARRDEYLITAPRLVSANTVVLLKTLTLHPVFPDTTSTEREGRSSFLPDGGRSSGPSRSLH